MVLFLVTKLLVVVQVRVKHLVELLVVVLLVEELMVH